MSENSIFFFLIFTLFKFFKFNSAPLFNKKYTRFGFLFLQAKWRGVLNFLFMRVSINEENKDCVDCSYVFLWFYFLQIRWVSMMFEKKKRYFINIKQNVIYLKKKTTKILEWISVSNFKCSILLFFWFNLHKNSEHLYLHPNWSILLRLVCNHLFSKNMPNARVCAYFHSNHSF